MLFLSAQRSHHGNYLLNHLDHVCWGKALVRTQVTWNRPGSPPTKTTASRSHRKHKSQIDLGSKCSSPMILAVWLWTVIQALSPSSYSRIGYPTYHQRAAGRLPTPGSQKLKPGLSSPPFPLTICLKGLSVTPYFLGSKQWCLLFAECLLNARLWSKKSYITFDLDLTLKCCGLRQ